MNLENELYHVLNNMASLYKGNREYEVSLILNTDDGYVLRWEDFRGRFLYEYTLGPDLDLELLYQGLGQVASEIITESSAPGNSGRINRGRVKSNDNRGRYNSNGNGNNSAPPPGNPPGPPSGPPPGRRRNNNNPNNPPGNPPRGGGRGNGRGQGNGRGNNGRQR